MNFLKPKKDLRQFVRVTCNYEGQNKSATIASALDNVKGKKSVRFRLRLCRNHPLQSFHGWPYSRSCFLLVVETLVAAWCWKSERDHHTQSKKKSNQGKDVWVLVVHIHIGKFLLWTQFWIELLTSTSSSSSLSSSSSSSASLSHLTKGSALAWISLLNSFDTYFLLTLECQSIKISSSTMSKSYKAYAKCNKKQEVGLVTNLFRINMRDACDWLNSLIVCLIVCNQFQSYLNNVSNHSSFVCLLNKFSICSP